MADAPSQDKEHTFADETPPHSPVSRSRPEPIPSDIINEVAIALRWKEQSEAGKWILLMVAESMKHRRLIYFMTALALAMFIGWGLHRDPELLAGGLVLGFIVGILAWLFKPAR